MKNKKVTSVDVFQCNSSVEREETVQSQMRLAPAKYRSSKMMIKKIQVLRRKRKILFSGYLKRSRWKLKVSWVRTWIEFSLHHNINNATWILLNWVKVKSYGNLRKKKREKASCWQRIAMHIYANINVHVRPLIPCKILILLNIKPKLYRSDVQPAIKVYQLFNTISLLATWLNRLILL